MKPRPIPEPNAQEARTYLEAETRLAELLPLNVSGQTMAELLTRIQRRTGITLGFGDRARAYQNKRVGMAGETMPCRAILDALAAVELCRWVRTGERRYELREPSPGAVPAVRQAASNEVTSRGLALRNLMRMVPPDQFKRMSNGQYLPFTRLSPRLKAAITELVNASNRADAASAAVTSGRREPILISMRDVEVGEISFQEEARPEVTRYRLFYRFRYDADGNMKSGSIPFNDALERGKPGAATELEELYLPVRFEIPLKEAKERTELQRVVSLRAPDLTYPEAAARLCAQARIPTLYFIERSAKRGNVNQSGLPLAEALEGLGKVFPEYEWEYRRMGFLIVREPSNPARRPQRA
jgi:hypothetical protein